MADKPAYNSNRTEPKVPYFDFLGVRKKERQQVWSIWFLLLYFAYELNCFCGLETEIPLSKIAEEL